MDITKALNDLANLRAALDAFALEKQSLVDVILTPEIKSKLADLDIEFEQKAAVAASKASSLEDEIKQAVIEHGASVKGAFLQAVWNRGRVSWNTKALEGYAAAHPEINTFRSQGEPTCTIRNVA